MMRMETTSQRDDSTCETVEICQQQLAQIDQEIAMLLNSGRLSSLAYPIEVTPQAKQSRPDNLKALLTARQYYRNQLQNQIN